MDDVLAIIPARGGSKGVERKNLRPVGGKPLIAWTAEVALACSSIDRVIVSTEDAQIADVARRLGVEVPFVRPKELAANTTPGIEPVLHALAWLSQHRAYRPGWVICLQPTSPLRQVEDVKAAIALARSSCADAVVSVSEARDHPYWSKRIDAEGRLSDFLAQCPQVVRRQDLPPVYALNGAIFLARRRLLRDQRSWYAGDTRAVIMPVERSLDVDTAWDLHLADLVLTERSRHAAD